MGTYKVPRNTKGESRILVVFSTKALVYTIVGLVIGYIISLLLRIFGIGGIVEYFIMAIIALIGFSIATFKIPNIGSIPVLNEVAGESIDEIIIRYIKYKRGKKKIYISDIKSNAKEEEKIDGK